MYSNTFSTFKRDVPANYSRLQSIQSIFHTHRCYNMYSRTTLPDSIHKQVRHLWLLRFSAVVIKLVSSPSRARLTCLSLCSRTVSTLSRLRLGTTTRNLISLSFWFAASLCHCLCDRHEVLDDHLLRLFLLFCSLSCSTKSSRRNLSNTWALCAREPAALHDVQRLVHTAMVPAPWLELSTSR